VYQKKDLLASIGIGLGNLAVNAVMKFVLFAIVLYFYDLSRWYFPVKWWSFALCIIWIDFWRYWAHRIAHEQRFWWCTHVTHHSSELYNFSVSFRLSWVEHIKIIFFIPVAIAGFDPIVFFICHEIEILYQFWIHTQLVKKLPAPIEYIFTTPSHHRVHHAKNPRYIDKNYGSTFIIWDRLFGTFQEEDEEPIYGITEPPNSYNPVYLVFHVWMEIWRDLKKAKSFKEAFDLIFGWPGIEKEMLYGKKDEGIQSLVSNPTT
jgi:sterol desaturase/sphingolipid hydroxylase (fatty acid hydroxylase superfamily)